MKKVGLKYPVVALYDETTGTYSNGMVMAKAIKAGLKWDKNNEKVYGDDGIDDLDQSITGGTESLEVTELPHEVQSFVLGHTLDSNNELVVNENDVAPYLGHGFYGKVKRNGVYKYRAVWLTKMQFSEPDDETETQGEKISFQTPTIEGVIMKDINGNYKKEKLFDYEVDAVAYLNTKAGIPQGVSSGLTALSLTGTGGTLSPTFATGTRYYTFGGLTGTSFTVTATAANHVIKLYVNDELKQTLTSGVASNTISMSAVGTSKVKIVAYENGKTSQTTEIIVVKTA